MNVSLIIAAGGAGQRFFQREKKHSGRSKLFVDLAGKPLLSNTLEAFQGIPQIREILLAVFPGTGKWIRTHVLNGSAKPPVRLVRGGATRAQSVWNALRKTSPKSEWVLVHDGARPFPPAKEIRALFENCSEVDGVILARPVVPTLKRVSSQNHQILETIDRQGLFEAETPQLVRRSVLVKAYQTNPKAFLATDEASLVEAVGGRVKIQAHTGWNVKVTTPEDLRLAEAYGVSRDPSGSVTVGLGRDTHRLVEGRKLYLGGVPIPFEKGALGHSDGDALLHAVCDAVLGAIGGGDIGEWFSDKDPRFKNARSEKFLEEILKKAEKKGWAPSHIDSVVILEKPRLGDLKARIQRKIAELAHLKEDHVSVKAKTQEGLGPEGEGLAVTCEALVLMRRLA